MTVIERAARALVVELIRQETDRAIPPEKVDFDFGDLRLGYIDQTDVDVGALVRAVLQAIREPTPEMIEACSDAMLEHGVDIYLDGREVRPMWQAMIDAALTE